MISDFYLITNPELVQDSISELSEVLPFCLTNSGRPCVLNDIEIKENLGGIELRAPIEIGLQLNLMMKTVTRVLLRLKTFECREFYNLEKELKKIDFGFLGKQKFKVSLNVSATQSKLGQEKKIEACAQKVWGANFQFSVPSEFQIYIRIEKDVVTVSLDTSGDPLYQRGVLEKRGPAPIRETFAAHMVRWMTSDLSLHEKKSIVWLDPMAGSGTLISEIADQNKKNLSRAFAFEKMNSLPLALKNKQSSAVQIGSSIENKKLIAADISTEALQWMKSNLKNLMNVQFLTKDLFAIKGRADYGFSDDEKLFIIVNPPYGHRLEIADTSTGTGLQSVLKQIFLLKPERLGFLAPEANAKLEFPESYQILSTHAFRNGGLPVVLTIYQKRSEA